MTRITSSLLCALLALSLLAGCSMPAPRPIFSMDATQPPANEPPDPAAPPPAAAPSEAPSPQAEAAPAVTVPTPPGWLAYIEPGCEGTCSNVSIARPGFVEPRALTNHKQGMVRQIFWSPTGKQIAFTFFTGGEKAHMELRLVPTKAGGKEVKLVTLKAGVEFGSINWSRSGKHLVYTAVKGNTSQIYRVTVQNKKVQKLSRSSKNIDADPVWSPDGKKIVFVSSRQPSKGPAEPRIPQLWVMKADGSGAKALVPDNSQENTNWEVFKPTWSPDGKKIVFIWLPQIDLHASVNVQLASLDTNAGGLWVVDAKGGPATLLAACGTIPTEAPVWSPDGKKIAMACGDQSQTLLVANLEDGSLAQSKAALGTNHSLSWSPDSTTILYIKKMDENRRAVQLFLPDGEVSLAMSDPVEADSVVWSPVDKLP